MDGFPSGQRGQTVNLLQVASVVRIHLHPFNMPMWLNSLRLTTSIAGRALITNQLLGDKYADVAQLAEQLICNQQVIGSSPIIGFVSEGDGNLISRGGAVWKLVGLITRRSQVQILLPQLTHCI